MPRYQHRQTKFPIKFTLQINDEYAIKLNALQERLGFGPVDPTKPSYRRARAIRACIDYTYASLFLDGDPLERIVNSD